MRLPMTTYEDQVGTRIKMINYAHMAFLILDAAGDPDEHTRRDNVESMLSLWGDAIYTLGKGAEPPVSLVQPLKVVG